MLNIFADALLIATRFANAPADANRNHPRQMMSQELRENEGLRLADRTRTSGR